MSLYADDPDIGACDDCANTDRPRTRHVVEATFDTEDGSETRRIAVWLCDECEQDRGLETPVDTNWFESHDNRVLTANYMADGGCTVGELRDFIEKPWKYEYDYKAAVAAAKEAETT